MKSADIPPSTRPKRQATRSATWALTCSILHTTTCLTRTTTSISSTATGFSPTSARSRSAITKTKPTPTTSRSLKRTALKLRSSHIRSARTAFLSSREQKHISHISAKSLSKNRSHSQNHRLTSLLRRAIGAMRTRTRRTHIRKNMPICLSDSMSMLSSVCTRTSFSRWNGATVPTAADRCSYIRSETLFRVCRTASTRWAGCFRSTS